MTMGKQHANGILNKKWGKQKSCLGQPTQVEQTLVCFSFKLLFSSAYAVLSTDGTAHTHRDKRKGARVLHTYAVDTKAEGENDDVLRVPLDNKKK